MAKANLDGVPDPKEFPLMPEGKYLMEVTTCEEALSEKGDTQWKVTLVAVGGEFKGAHVWDYLTWSAAAFPRVKQFLVAMGLRRQGDVVYAPTEVIGKSVMVSVVQKPYKDKMTNKVAFSGYEAAGSASMPATADSDGDPGEPPADLGVNTDDVPF